MLLRGRHYRTGETLDFTVASGRIGSVAPAGSATADLEGDYVAPALFDIQINGGHGVNFTSESLTRDDVARVVQVCHEHGIGQFCPTVITASVETICHALATLAKARDENPRIAAAVPGFHLEGPYLSPEDGPRGAHPRDHVRPASLEEFRRFQEAAVGRIRLVTLAPEVPGAMALIEQLTQKLKVRVAIGHSAASPAVIRDAVRAGATLSTHLGNGCSRLLPRHENLLWEQLASDELTAGIIPDGHHLPWSLVKCVLRCKGAGRMVLTSDASPLAGLPPGKYRPWGDEVEVLPEGKIILASQGVLAGSWDFTNRCVEKLLRHSDGWSLADVHDLASVRPAAYLGVDADLFPRLEPGAVARLVLYRRDSDGNLRLTHSVIGERVYEIPATA